MQEAVSADSEVYESRLNPGLDVHDPSHFGSVAPYRYQPGDVFTIEPGIYVREAVFEGLPDTARNRRLIERTGDAALRVE